ncbi:UDP-N-acetylmuramoyl-tripeptide--D-alanyl-D-alanine ligase [Brevibacillus sp. TJ4]|uniref:UDP-N-acetylmuramoyl-tripeptide--D-alanyl-D- alanine ligase n=1 Tax=Brevibacillus sp. TJ4 TaxID=3234853 RepID=UPI0037D6B00F
MQKDEKKEFVKARARIRRLLLHKPVIAVTGSAGKTTTKEMIAAILSRKWKVYKSKYNRNFLGNTRAHVKRIKAEHKAAVLEFGMLRRGHIRRHCQIIRPSYGVITNIGTAHIGNFGGSRRGIAMAKSELIRHMKRRGVVFVNQDCPYSRRLHKQPFAGNFAGKFVTVGIENPADYQASNIEFDESGVYFSCLLKGVEVPFYVPMMGLHTVYNALFAIAVAHTLGFGYRTIQRGLRFFRGQKKRLTHYRLRSQDIHILDDTYSSNPHAAKAAIDVLRNMGEGTKIAVLASMLEMGRYEVKGHDEVGRYVQQSQLDYLYTLGKSARHIAKGAIRAGFPADRVIHCSSRQQLHRQLQKRIKPHTFILVKGSRKLKMGKTVQFLCQQTRKIGR